MHRKDVTITVVIAVRNMVETLERTILSVLNQTYANKELIIMDCESTDGTVDVIRNYESRLKYWISAPDGGPSDAIAKALDHADGDLIGFLGAGDWYEPYALEKVAEKYSHVDGDLYYGNMCVHYADHIEVKDLSEFRSDKLFSRGTQWLGAVCAFAKKKLLIENYKKNNQFLLTDFLFFMRMYAESRRFTHIGCEDPITHFLIGGRTTTLTNKVAIDAYDVRKQVMEEYPDAWNDYEECWTNIEAEHVIDLMEYNKSIWMREENKKMIFDTININLDTEYVLFGCGNRGKQCQELLRWLGARIGCFVDNDVNKWGTSIGDTDVKDISYLENKCDMNIIITTGYEWAEQIEEQLRLAGILGDNSVVRYADLVFPIKNIVEND